MVLSVPNIVSTFIHTAFPHSVLRNCRAYLSQHSKVLFIALLGSLSIGCSKSTSSLPAEEEPRLTLADSNLQDPIAQSVATPEALVDLQDTGVITSALPTIVSTEILAKSGLQVAYTQTSQSDIVSGLNIESHWLHMQSCLHQVGVAPLVLIHSAAITSLTSADDVIHTIEGTPVASATSGSIPVIQISLSDFLVSGQSNGYNLRSIMGRVLWSAAGLSVRDYPYSCAQQLVEPE